MLERFDEQRLDCLDEGDQVVVANVAGRHQESSARRVVQEVAIEEVVVLGDHGSNIAIGDPDDLGVCGAVSVCEFAGVHQVTARDRASRTRVRRWDLAGWLGCLGWCEGGARRRLRSRAPSRTTGTEIFRLPRPGGPEQRVRTRTGAIRTEDFDRCVLLRLRQRRRSGWLLRCRLRRRSSRWLIRGRTSRVLGTGPASLPRVQASVEMR